MVLYVESEAEVPHSNQALVAKPFGFAEPFKAAPVVVTELTGLVATLGEFALKFAVADLLEFIITAHEPVPEQAPDQPVKVEPADAEAVRVTEAPELYVPEQSAPQFMPAGEEVTVPEPVPDLETVRV